MEQIKILIIDDDKGICQQISDLLNGIEISGYWISVESQSDFEQGKADLRMHDYDIVILDVYRGTPSETNYDLAGKEILEEIKKTVPIAVIFYTGLTKHVEELRSDLVRVVSKSTGSIDGELKLLIETGLPILRKKLIDHVRAILRDYYWEFIDKNSEMLRSAEDKVVSEYLLLRRLAATLTRNSVNKIFGNSISPDKVHPLEFYVCPPLEETVFETGDILKKENDGTFHVVLTPSCDFAQGNAEYILLASAVPLKETLPYKGYQKNPAKEKENLLRLIGSRKGDRYFFLPRNEFIGMPDLVLDFQKVENLPFSGFSGYKKLAKIDDPFAQDMLATFIRNKNRPGSPDLDANYVLKYLEEDLAKERAGKTQ